MKRVVIEATETQDGKSYVRVFDERTGHGRYWRMDVPFSEFSSVTGDELKQITDNVAWVISGCTMRFSEGMAEQARKDYETRNFHGD